MNICFYIITLKISDGLMSNKWLMGDDLMGEANIIAVLLRLATNHKRAGSNYDGLIGISHWHFPSGCNMKQLLTEISTTIISLGVKGADE